MKTLFLTVDALMRYVRDYPDKSIEKAIFFFSRKDFELMVKPHSFLVDRVKMIERVIDMAHADCRALWRDENSSGNMNVCLLNSLLKDNDLEPLNSNLPSIDKPEFFKAAVERTNNRNGNQRVEAFV